MKTKKLKRIIVTLLFGFFLAWLTKGLLTFLILGGKTFSNRSLMIQIGIILSLSIFFSTILVFSYYLFGLFFPSQLCRFTNKVNEKERYLKDLFVRTIRKYLLIDFSETINFNLFEILSPFIILFVPLIITQFNDAFIEGGSQAYWKFSQSIFQPQRQYYAESILHPLIAHIFGLNRTFIYYKIYSLFTNLTWLYFLNLFINKTNIREYQRFLVLFIICTSKVSISNTIMFAFPDSFTILGTVFLLLGTNWVPIIVGGIIAALSHFSITLFVLLNVIILRIMGSEFENFKDKLNFAITAISGVAIGRIILEIWIRIFQYDIFSRFKWVIEKGVDFWIEFNVKNWRDLLGLEHFFYILLIIGIVVIFYLQNDRLYLAILACFIISIIPTLITIDRPRVFVLIYWPVLAYSLLEFFRNKKISSRMRITGTWFVSFCLLGNMVVLFV